MKIFKIMGRAFSIFTALVMSLSLVGLVTVLFFVRAVGIAAAEFKNVEGVRRGNL